MEWCNFGYNTKAIWRVVVTLVTIRRLIDKRLILCILRRLSDEQLLLWLQSEGYLIYRYIWYRKFHYLLENPLINRFINTGLIYEIYKIILFWNRDNQQETKVILDSSETACEMFFDLYNVPQHKKIDPLFLEWFIGFVEGHGSFIISNKKIYFDISQNLVDISILYLIKNRLGFGKILEKKELDRFVGVYYITGKANFTRLIHLFNGNLICKYNKNQFKLWLDQYNLQYLDNIQYLDRNIQLSFFNGWLSGFIDAEGSFNAKMISCKTNRIGKQVFTDFSITLKHPEILVKIKSLFILYINNNNNNDKYIIYDKFKDEYKLSLSNKKILILLINYLNKYPLLTIKNIKYKNWLNIYQASLNNKHLTSEDFLNISKFLIKFSK